MVDALHDEEIVSVASRLLLVGAVAPLELPERRVEVLRAGHHRPTLNLDLFPARVVVFDGILDRNIGMGVQHAHPRVSPRADAVDGGDESSLIRDPDKGTRVRVLLEPEGDVLGVAGSRLEDGDVLQRPAGKRLVHVIPNGLDLECGCRYEAAKVIAADAVVVGVDSLAVSWRRVGMQVTA